MTISRRLTWLLLAALLVVACGGNSTPAPAPEATAPAATVAPATDGATDGVAAPESPTDAPASAAPTLGDDAVTTESGLRYADATTGEGAAAETGDLVTVNYTGYLEDGYVFDSSYDRDEPFTFTLGAGRVIPGWDEGLVGMQPGGTRLLAIPPDLAYGDETRGPIPAGSTLIFEVEMLDVQPSPEPAEVDRYETTEGGAEYATLEAGEGDGASEGDIVTFDFFAWREDGLLFDSSIQAGRTATFPVGQSGLPGLDQGLEGVKVGETRQIRIPPELAYGAEGAGDVIPPDETIIFEVTVLDITQLPSLSLAETFQTTDEGVEYAIVEAGTGDEVKAGDTISVQYTGYLEDGTIFDSSRQSGQPFVFTIGEGGVIPGWEAGVRGMKVGETRQLRIPPELAYGEGGIPGTIPPSATLIFDVELVEILAQ